LFNFDDSIFSNEKLDQRYNQFKFDPSIFSNEKPEQLPPRRDRNIQIRDGTTASWKNMIHDYEIYCESAKNDLITFLFKVTEKLYEIAAKELKIKNSISFQLVAVVDYIEVNLSGEQVNRHRKHFRSTRNIIVHSNAIKSALTSAKNEVLRNFDRYNAQNTRYRFDKVVKVDVLSDQNNPLRGGAYIQLPNFIISKKCCINVKNIKTNKFKCLKQENLRCLEYSLES
ncbi:MAG: hypothetical protein H9Q66_06675, partial [Spiroplasma ixodetis]|nr:hypothetical protein [Spiroplasma ixodetis]